MTEEVINENLPATEEAHLQETPPTSDEVANGTGVGDTGEDDRNDDEVEEEYAGEYNGDPNIKLTLNIFEDQVIEKLGSITLSNFDQEEINKMRQILFKRIAESQEHRYKLVDEGAGVDFLVTDLEGTSIYITAKERDAIRNLANQERTVRRGAGWGLFENTENEGWDNLPSYGDNKVAIGQVDYRSSNDPIVRIRGELGLSTEFTAPMWHSGLFLKIQGAGTLDQLTMESRLLIEKADEARNTLGFVYSASAVYLNRRIADFILEHVVSSTLGTTNVEQLKRVLLLTDLEPLALAGAATIWPKGYNMERPCLTSSGGCGHSLKRLVHPRRMLLVRRRRLTDDQMRLMTKKTGKVDIKTIRTYQDSIRPEVSRYIDLTDELMLKLRVPTIHEYERVASAWMERMDKRARELLSTNASEEEREIFMAKANSVSIVMAYGHWVEAVVRKTNELDAVPEVMVSRAPIDTTDLEAQYMADIKFDRLLEDLSANPELTDAIIEGIEKFINNMTISTAVVPKVNCPKCHKPVTGDELSDHPHVVGVNPIELFFILLRHKIVAAGG